MFDVDVDLNRTLANTWDIIMGVIGFAMVVVMWVWTSRHERKRQSIALLFSVIGIVSGFAMRVSYFVPGRMVAPPGKFQHEWWLEWRWLALGLITLWTLFWADRLYVSLFSRVRWQERLSIYIVLFALAFILAQIRIS